MGVLEFFGTLIRNGVTASSITPFFKQKMDIDHLFIDFNSIIHNSNQFIITEINEFMKNVLKNAYEGTKLNTDYLNEMFDKYGMKEDQKKIINNSSPKNIVRHFVNHFNYKYVDYLIIKHVFFTLKSILSTFCKNKTIKTLMIAIDGVPSKGKMIEQKQRRYMSAIIECYKKKIFDKYEKYLCEQPDYVYYSTKYSILGNRNKITPGTGFMNRMVKFLREKASKKLTKNRPNMEIIISDMYEVGEGEKKIMNFIQNNIDRNSRIMVYSPDSDVILLCMLLPTTNTFMLRHNKQSSDDKKCDVYDLINIQSLKENISFYINTCTKGRYLTDRINNDIIFLSTIFGNDFVPKIESINVKTGFQNILDAYLKIIRPNNYLVNFSKENFTINFIFLKKILHELIPLEEDFIDNNPLYNKYIMAGKIKYVFDYMNVNIYNVREIISDFRKAYGKLKGDIQNNNSVLQFESDNHFMSSLKRAIDICIDNKCVNTINLSNKEMINLLKQYYQINKKFPGLNINDNTKSHRIKDKRFQNILKEANEYQIEIFSFEKMLGDYYKKFNAEPLDLSRNNIGNYYQNYFSINFLYTSKGDLTEEASNVMKTYIEGILWVFNYYFNDKSYINSWYYKYERAPLLQHLLLYLNSIDENTFNKIFLNLKKYSISNLEDYFNPIEQFIYVSPMTDMNLKLLPSNYINFIKNNKEIKKYFFDIPSFTKKLWDEDKSKEVDCHSIPYLNKCFVSKIRKFTYKEDRIFLRIIRQVKSDKKSLKRSKIRYPSF
jgi:5'-3' exonuclease